MKKKIISLVSLLALLSVTVLSDGTDTMDNYLAGTNAGANLETDSTGFRASGNTFVGVSSGEADSTGSANTGLGYGTLRGLTTGRGNLGLGYMSGQGLTTESHKLYIHTGYYPTYGIFGDFSTGYFGINKSSPTVALDVTGAGLFSGDLGVSGKIGVNDMIATTDSLVVGMSQYSIPDDSMFVATITSGEPKIAFLASNDNEWNITTNTSDQEVHTGATGGATFDNEIIQGIQSSPYNFSTDTGTTYNHQIYAWSNAVAGGENYKAINVVVVDTTDATDTNWQGIKAGDFRTYKKIGTGLSASPYSTGTELWGTQSVVDISGTASVRNMFGAAGIANVDAGNSVTGHTLNPAVVSGGFFTGFVDSLATLTNVLDVPLIGQVDAEAGNARAKADAAVGAMLVGDTGDPSTTAVAAFRVFDANSVDNFDYAFDAFYDETGFAANNVFNIAEIRLSNEETIDNKDDGKIRVVADSLALAMSAYSISDDSLLVLSLPSGVPTIAGFAPDATTSTIKWNDGDIIDIDGATVDFGVDPTVATVTAWIDSTNITANGIAGSDFVNPLRIPHPTFVTGLITQHDGSVPTWGNSPTGLAVEGTSEFDGAVYFDGDSRFGAFMDIYNNIRVNDTLYLSFGGGYDTRMKWETTEANDAWKIGQINGSSNNYIFTTVRHLEDNTALPVSPHPTIAMADSSGAVGNKITALFYQFKLNSTLPDTTGWIGGEAFTFTGDSLYVYKANHTIVSIP